MKKVKNNKRTRAILIGVFIIYALFIITICVSLAGNTKKVNEELPQPNYQVLAEEWENKYNVLLEIHIETIKNLKQNMTQTESIEETSFTSKAIEEISLPDTPTNMYFCMDENKLTCETSYQYQLQTSGKLYVGDYGIQTYIDDDDNQYFMVALGGYFGENIGNTWKVTLENGSSFNIMQGDCKANMWYGHPCTNYDGEECTNIIEFIVDMDYVPDKVLASGTMSSVDYFNANIKSMEYTGRVWTPDI